MPLQQGPEARGGQPPAAEGTNRRRGCFELMPLVAPVAPIPDPFEERKDIRNSSSNIRRARGQRGRVGAGEPQHELATGSSGSAAPGLTRSSASSSASIIKRSSTTSNLNRLHTGSVHDTTSGPVYLAHGSPRGSSSTEGLTRRAAATVGRAMCRVLRLPAAAQADSGVPYSRA